ncbi:MAG: hypothetical protein AAGA65_29995 [Actinomycetota bacterium]
MKNKIGLYEAAQLMKRIRVMGQDQRRALFADCAAKCPPGKNKRHLRQQAEADERRAA